MPDWRMRAHTSRAIPPVALGIEWMLVGPDARTGPPCLLYSFAICSPGRAMLAQKIKLLAHDNKLRACCLLNLPAASSLPASGLCNLCCGIFSDSELACTGGTCGAEVHTGILPHSGFDREQNV